MKSLKRLLNKLLFNKEKTILAFEYAIVLLETAKKQKIKLTPELIKKAEDMIENEFSQNGPTRLAVDMIPNILSLFELDLSK